MIRSRIALVVIALTLPLNALGQKQFTKENTQAEAQIAKGPLEALMQPMVWGMSPDAVLNLIRREIDAKWAEKIKEADTLNMDRFLKLKRVEREALEESFTRFLGQKTGYESSVIGSEFRAQNGESMLLVKRPKETYFLFFKDESLWKVCMVRDAGIDYEYSAFLKSLSESIVGAGTPQSQKSSDGMSYIWRSDKTVLQTVDRSDFFNAYVLRFLQAERGEAIEEEHAKAPKPKKDISSAESRGLLDSIVDSEDVDEEPEDDVVDQLTGVDHQVDLVTGRPAYAEPLESPVVGDDLRSEKSLSESKPAKAESKKRRAKKKRQVRKKSSKKSKKTLLKGESENGIVY